MYLVVFAPSIKGLFNPFNFPEYIFLVIPELNIERVLKTFSIWIGKLPVLAKQGYKPAAP